MSDLISRSALIENIKSRKYISTALYEIFATIIDEQPIAYDKEAVVEKLERLPNREADYYYASSNDVIDREDAIEIVKEGGIDG